MRRILELNHKTVEVIKAELKGAFVTSNDDLRIHAILNESLGILKELSCENGDCGGASLRKGSTRLRLRCPDSWRCRLRF